MAILDVAKQAATPLPLKQSIVFARLDVRSQFSCHFRSQHHYISLMLLSCSFFLISVIPQSFSR